MTGRISLNDAAEELGVHYMTAYRYVRTGRLPAVKERGQWWVEPTDIEQFSTSDVERSPRRDVLPQLVERRLLAADENGSLRLLEDAMAAGASAEEVYLDLLGPALAEIGHRWSIGEISIADEHVATATALRVISRLGPRIASRGRTKGTILLAGVADDYHTLPTAMLRDLLRARSFEVHDLGAHTPAESIVERSRMLADLVAVGLAVTNGDNEEVIAETLATIEAASLGVPVVIGGPGIGSPEIARSLGRCVPTTSARHALDEFDRIHDTAARAS